MHIWLRAESRPNETRVGLTPEGARKLMAAGYELTVEDSQTRCISTQRYADIGARIARQDSWPHAPENAVIFGLKELPDEDTPLAHKHILFGHAYKGQPSGRKLLSRFAAGGGTLLDLEYLTDEDGKRVAAFGYWAGYAGAAVTLKCWAAQKRNELCGPIDSYDSANHLLSDLQSELVAQGTERPTAIIIGALGRVGTGAHDLCTAMGVPTTGWDMAETAHGGPFPEILAHDLFLNCILARPGTPTFVSEGARVSHRRLSVIGDIACDPGSDFNPIKVYDRTTSWERPALRVHDQPMLDVTAIDNLPSMLPVESSEDFASQLLPTLLTLDKGGPVWSRAEKLFERCAAQA